MQDFIEKPEGKYIGSQITKNSNNKKQTILSDNEGKK